MKPLLRPMVVVVGMLFVAPSAPAAHEDTLAGTSHQLIGLDGREVGAELITKKPYLFIYFSAGWCPLCKKFTPQLAEFYRQHHRNRDFELLFVSSDKSPDEMRKYWATAGIPGLAL